MKATQPQCHLPWGIVLRVVLVLALVTSVVSQATLPTRAQEPEVSFWLTLLHNNDSESQFINAGGGLEDFGGVARFASLVKQLKLEARRGRNRAGIMVSSGDNFLAGPEFNASLQKGPPFFDTIAMELIGYDAAAIGNHEFDFGPDVLADFIGAFGPRVPFVSANLDFSQEPNLQALVDSGRIAKSTVVIERGERIGIVGATTPNLPFISSPRNVAVDPDVADAIQAEINKLEAQGVNKIILISHLQDIDEDLALLPLLSGVDIAVAGGGDELLANPGDLLLPGDDANVFGPYPLMATGGDGAQIPVVTTTGGYRYVGRLVVGFDEQGHLLAIDESSGPARVSGVPPDGVIPSVPVDVRVVTPVQDVINALAANIIGTSEVDLDGRRSEVRSRETNEGNLIADALRWQATQLAPSFGVPVPEVALQNGGGIRNDSIIPAGSISELDTFDMVPFSNFVTVVPGIPRSQFKEILENAVSRTQPGDAPGGTGRFAQISGFTMEWFASGTAQVLNPDGTVATPGTRVQEVQLNDSTVIVTAGAVVAGPNLSIATIDFLARGGDEYPYRGAPFTTMGVTYQQALSDYITMTLLGTITTFQYPEGGEGRNAELP